MSMILTSVYNSSDIIILEIDDSISMLYDSTKKKTELKHVVILYYIEVAEMTQQFYLCVLVAEVIIFLKQRRCSKIIELGYNIHD